MPLDIHVDRDVCRAARACVRRAPRTFSLDAEGKSTVAVSPGDDEASIREAANACPFFAIEVRESPASGS